MALGNPIGPTRAPGAVGVPFPSTEIRVVDPDDPDVDRPPGERGELLIRGPAGLRRLLEQAGGDRARRCSTAAGSRTGDIVEVDEDGFVSMVDRIKEIIITGGFNVMPSEVEAVLCSTPA